MTDVTSAEKPRRHRVKLASWSVNWVERGQKPASGDVTLQLALEAPQSTLNTTVSTVTNELTFDEAVLAAAGLPLP